MLPKGEDRMAKGVDPYQTGSALLIVSACPQIVDLQISPRKKLLFRVHSVNKNSNTQTFVEKTVRDFV